MPQTRGAVSGGYLALLSTRPLRSWARPCGPTFWPCWSGDGPLDHQNGSSGRLGR